MAQSSTDAKAGSGPKGDVGSWLRDAAERANAGRIAEAQALYEQILRVDPNHPQALHDAALLARMRGDQPAAIELMTRAAAAAPQSAELRNSLAVVLGSVGRCEEALASFDEAIRLNGDYADAYSNRGVVLARLGREDEAVAAWERALAIQPTHIDARSHLGALCVRSGRPLKGAEHLREAVRLAPNSADARNNLGTALRESGDLDGAIAEYRKAMELSPQHVDAMTNLGAATNELGRPREAVPLFRETIELRSDFALAHWNLALSLLSLGEFEPGWREFEWRKQIVAEWAFTRRLPQPQWNGSSVAGATVLVICEQGLGDTFQFVRYLPLLKERRARVVLECQPALAPLMQQVAWIDRVVPRGEPLPPFDIHVHLLSLPGIFGTRIDTIPARVPYLNADVSRADRWSAALSGGGKKIGIAWQGDPRAPAQRARSIPLSAFAPLANVPEVQLFSLQKGHGVEQIPARKDRLRLAEFDPPLDQDAAFLDAAAVMKRLDLVITSDTSIAHLAGGLGVPVWVALPKVADWRWMQERPDSPWYPTMRLFRQTVPGAWGEVFDRMAAVVRRGVST